MPPCPMPEPPRWPKAPAGQCLVRQRVTNKAALPRPPRRSLPRRHEVPRRGQGLYPLRRRRKRLRVVPAREIHRVRRAERRRRRPRRRRGGGGGQRPQHADRLPLPAAFQGQARRQRHGQGPPWRQRRRHGDEGAGRHADLRGGRRDPARRPHQGGRARHPGEGRQRRLRQRPLQDLDQPRAAPRQSGPGGRGAHHPAAPQADRRCRHRRPAECGQVDLSRRRQRRQAEDRRLSVHHAAPAARRGR